MKQKIGAALQTTSLQPKITPREALTLFAGFYRTAASPGELLTRFGLSDKGDAAFDTLSGGQRQRLALALAFVNQPEVVVLDEPTAGLDPASRRELHREIARMKEDGHTVLLTTHYLEEAEQVCDRIAIMHQGRIVAWGTQAPTALSINTHGPVDAATIAELRRWLESRGIAVTDIRAQHASLEQVFLELTNAD
jgi:ABC-2 type transport system ATP-binding protein